jgi:hypothetical protein
MKEDISFAHENYNNHEAMNTDMTTATSTNTKQQPNVALPKLTLQNLDGLVHALSNFLENNNIDNIDENDRIAIDTIAQYLRLARQEEKWLRIELDNATRTYYKNVKSNNNNDNSKNNSEMNIDLLDISALTITNTPLKDALQPIKSKKEALSILVLLSLLEQRHIPQNEQQNKTNESNIYNNNTNNDYSPINTSHNTYQRLLPNPLHLTMTLVINHMDAALFDKNGNLISRTFNETELTAITMNNYKTFNYSAYDIATTVLGLNNESFKFKNDTGLANIQREVGCCSAIRSNYFINTNFNHKLKYNARCRILLTDPYMVGFWLRHNTNNDVFITKTVEKLKQERHNMYACGGHFILSMTPSIFPFICTALLSLPVDTITNTTFEWWLNSNMTHLEQIRRIEHHMFSSHGVNNFVQWALHSYDGAIISNSHAECALGIKPAYTTNGNVKCITERKVIFSNTALVTPVSNNDTTPLSLDTTLCRMYTMQGNSHDQQLRLSLAKRIYLEAENKARITNTISPNKINTLSRETLTPEQQTGLQQLLHNTKHYAAPAIINDSDDNTNNVNIQDNDYQPISLNTDNTTNKRKYQQITSSNNVTSTSSTVDNNTTNASTAPLSKHLTNAYANNNSTGTRTQTLMVIVNCLHSVFSDFLGNNTNTDNSNGKNNNISTSNNNNYTNQYDIDHTNSNDNNGISSSACQITPSDMINATTMNLYNQPDINELTSKINSNSERTFLETKISKNISSFIEIWMEVDAVLEVSTGIIEITDNAEQIIVGDSWKAKHYDNPSDQRQRIATQFTIIQDSRQYTYDNESSNRKQNDWEPTQRNIFDNYIRNSIQPQSTANIDSTEFSARSDYNVYTNYSSSNECKYSSRQYITKVIKPNNSNKTKHTRSNNLNNVINDVPILITKGEGSEERFLELRLTIDKETYFENWPLMSAVIHPTTQIRVIYKNSEIIIVGDDWNLQHFNNNSAKRRRSPTNFMCMPECQDVDKIYNGQKVDLQNIDRIRNNIFNNKRSKSSNKQQYNNEANQVISKNINPDVDEMSNYLSDNLLAFDDSAITKQRQLMNYKLNHNLVDTRLDDCRLPSRNRSQKLCLHIQQQLIAISNGETDVLPTIETAVTNNANQTSFRCGICVQIAYDTQLIETNIKKKAYAEEQKVKSKLATQLPPPALYKLIGDDRLTAKEITKARKATSNNKKKVTSVDNNLNTSVTSALTNSPASMSAKNPSNLPNIQHFEETYVNDTDTVNTSSDDSAMYNDVYTALTDNTFYTNNTCDSSNDNSRFSHNTSAESSQSNSLYVNNDSNQSSNIRNDSQSRPSYNTTYDNRSDHPNNYTYNRKYSHFNNTIQNEQPHQPKSGMYNNEYDLLCNQSYNHQSSQSDNNSYHYQPNSNMHNIQSSQFSSSSSSTSSSQSYQISNSTHIYEPQQVAFGSPANANHFVDDWSNHTRTGLSIHAPGNRQKFWSTDATINSLPVVNKAVMTDTLTSSPFHNNYNEDELAVNEEINDIFAVNPLVLSNTSTDLVSFSPFTDGGRSVNDTSRPNSRHSTIDVTDTISNFKDIV